MQENNLQVKAKKKKRRRNELGILFGSIILCIVTLTAVTFCLVMVFKYRASQLENVEVMNELEQMQGRYTQEEVDVMISRQVEEAALQAAESTQEEMLARMKELMLSGDGAVNMLRQFFPEEIVLSDGSQYYFFPILETLAKHEYQSANFIPTDEGFLEYYENGELLSHKGIDVSRYQEKIEWDKVAGDGIEYAFIRLGIRGYTEGEIVEDEAFTYNIENALDNGIEAGIYFFTQATSVEEAREEAQFVLDALEPYDVTYPVVLDVEAVSNKNARTADLTKEERTEYCLTFCEMIKQAGYTPMIYGNLKSFMLLLDLEQLEEYDKWFAHYDTEVYFPYDFKIWQYTDTGKVAGIDGDVDINISFLEPVQ
ncbi:MAG: glycoside hydrolase family 25 protein [Roseburia sp.]|nr:glycoside hydrolase family 25 protein [Ruminococcus sp.]MCM1155844.1 glycoside hydrolase family 25 protein [Roseburia sp.]MCM1243980.1 glycoside hydrolase family 25 protein [Roseburia sp.]